MKINEKFFIKILVVGVLVDIMLLLSGYLTLIDNSYIRFFSRIFQIGVILFFIEAVLFLLFLIKIVITEWWVKMCKYYSQRLKRNCARISVINGYCLEHIEKYIAKKNLVGLLGVYAKWKNLYF